MCIVDSIWFGKKHDNSKLLKNDKECKNVAMGRVCWLWCEVVAWIALFLWDECQFRLNEQQRVRRAIKKSNQNY